ncbi:MAG: TetR family transcriptional regulator, partial [Deltaproteobacteria bacterium]|nr:TetR family transcriptional regulator [Deltaproteobacteria bacterium]
MARVNKQTSPASNKRKGKPAITTKAAKLAQGQAARENRVRRQRGRQEVMAAVLDAATALFAARGPASVSVRDLANAAQVN